MCARGERGSNSWWKDLAPSACWKRARAKRQSEWEIVFETHLVEAVQVTPRFGVTRVVLRRVVLGR